MITCDFFGWQHLMSLSFTHGWVVLSLVVQFALIKCLSMGMANGRLDFTTAPCSVKIAVKYWKTSKNTWNRKCFPFYTLEMEEVPTSNLLVYVFQLAGAPPQPVARVPIHNAQPGKNSHHHDENGGPAPNPVAGRQDETPGIFPLFLQITIGAVRESMACDLAKRIIPYFMFGCITKILSAIKKMYIYIYTVIYSIIFDVSCVQITLVHQPGKAA